MTGCYTALHTVMQCNAKDLFHKARTTPKASPKSIMQNKIFCLHLFNLFNLILNFTQSSFYISDIRLILQCSC